MPINIDQSLTEAQIEEVKSHLGSVDEILKPTCKVMTQAERIEYLRARKGFEGNLAMLLQVARDFHVELPTYNYEALERSVNIQSYLNLMNEQIQSIQTMVQDTYRAARADAWEGFLNYYNVLNAMANSMPELKSRMKTFGEFMSKTSRKQNDNEGKVAESDNI